MSVLSGMELPYAVCDDSTSYMIYIREILKKPFYWSCRMVVKLMHGIITYTVTNMKAIVCYHIGRNHCAYLTHRKTMLSKVRCSTRVCLKIIFCWIGNIIYTERKQWEYIKMLIKCYEISGYQWNLSTCSRGWRLVAIWKITTWFQCCPCGLHRGGAWRELTECYDSWKTVYSRFCKWRDDSTLQAVFYGLNADTNYETLNIDYPQVKAYQYSVGTKKRWQDTELNRSEKSRSGNSTKIYAVVDDLGNPVYFRLSNCQFQTLNVRIKLVK